MKNGNLSPNAKALIFGGAWIVGTHLLFRRAVNRQLKRAKEIRAWELMNAKARDAARKRLMEMADDPTVSAAELIKAGKEEVEFLKIISNQPMH